MTRDAPTTTVSLRRCMCLKADGRWRMMLFNDASESTDRESRLWRMCDLLSKEAVSPVRTCAAGAADVVSVIDLRAVFQHCLYTISVEGTHPFLTPKKGRYGLADTETMYCSDSCFDLYDHRNLDRANGCLMIVGPDQFVADVLPLDAFDAAVAFFSGVLLNPDAPDMT